MRLPGPGFPGDTLVTGRGVYWKKTDDVEVETKAMEHFLKMDPPLKPAKDQSKGTRPGFILMEVVDG